MASAGRGGAGCALMGVALEIGVRDGRAMVDAGPPLEQCDAAGRAPLCGRAGAGGRGGGYKTRGGARAAAERAELGQARRGASGWPHGPDLGRWDAGPPGAGAAERTRTPRTSPPDSPCRPPAWPCTQPASLPPLVLLAFPPKPQRPAPWRWKQPVSIGGRRAWSGGGEGKEAAIAAAAVATSSPGFWGSLGLGNC